MNDTLVLCLALVFLATFSHSVSGQCTFGFSERITPPKCPYYDTPTISTTIETAQVTPEDGGASYTVTQTRTNVETKIGFCGSYKYPRSVDGNFYDEFGTVGAEDHSYIMTYGDPWCNTALLFTTCLAERPTPFHPPAYAVNVRPPVLHESGSPNVFTTTTPPKLPLWDEGGYFYRTITVRINDSCLDPIFDPNFEIRTDAQPKTFMSIVNGTITYGFSDSLDSSLPSSNEWARAYVTSRLAECPAFIGTLPECVVSHTTCDTVPMAKCTSTQRTLPITRYPSNVRFACHDPEYGYVWRIDNDGAPGLHYDWRLTRGNGLLIDPVNNPGDLTLPSNTTERNLLYDDTLIAGFWPGTSGKHTAERLTWFFLPTWLDAGNATRPSRLDLYAGFPGHYNGTTTLGALVEFFEFETLMEFDMLNAIGFVGFTYDDVPDPTFPGDFERQVLLHICETPGLADAASIYVTGGTEDWGAWCIATVLNETATWSFTLNLTQSTFAQLTPGDPDPLPQCLCGSGTLLCGDDTPAGDPMLMQYDYIRTINRTVDFRLEPVCRMPLPGDPVLPVSNLPPYDYFPGPSSPINTATVPTAEVSEFLPFWPPPGEIVTINSTSYFEYPTLPFGVMWNLSNVNRDTLATGFTARFFFANTDGGVPDTAEVTVPYEYLYGDVILNPLKSQWLLSRTLIGQNVFGHINWRCTDTATCETEATPVYPPDYSPLNPNYVASSEFAVIDEFASLAAVTALPPCECYVNIPCDGGKLLETTSVDVNVAALDAPPAPPPGPPTYVNISGDCIPTLETCNCLDDNCDGIIDNVIGLNSVCGLSDVGRCELGVFACNITLSLCNNSQPFICLGAVYPELEKCDGQDWNCDGTPNNVPNLGDACGSNIGICEYGEWACDSPNPEPLCVGGVGPEPEDICGNGLDDDCDGLIDFNCVPGPSPPAVPPPAGPSPSPTGPTPFPGTPPSTAPTTTPPPAPDELESGIGIPPVDFPTPDISVAASVFTLVFCCLISSVLVYCAILRRNRRWQRQRFPLFY